MQEQLGLFDGDTSHIKKAIDRIQAFAPIAERTGGYFVAYSGGKDSDVILDLTKMAGVKFDAHYNLTSVDPPELVNHIRNNRPEVSIDRPMRDGKQTTMWNLIVKKRMPPTRLARYCCEHLKEGGGDGRFVITGVRWAESVRRKATRQVVETNTGSRSKDPSKKFMLNSDNDEARQMVEQCQIRSKHVLNPIVDWTDEQVWDFIRARGINYCSLYDEGFTRLGCIGCPFGGPKSQNREFDRWPKYKQAYQRAFGRMLEKRKADGLRTGWTSAQEVMDWWIEDRRIKK